MLWEPGLIFQSGKYYIQSFNDFIADDCNSTPPTELDAHHIAITFDGAAKVFGAGLTLETEATSETRENDVYNFGLLILQLLNNLSTITKGDSNDITVKTALEAWQIGSLCCKAKDLPSASLVRMTWYYCLIGWA